MALELEPTTKSARMLPVSWVEGSDEGDFPIQNLPYGVFSHEASGRDARIGVAIGASVLDVRALLVEGLLDGCTCAHVFADATLNAFMARPAVERRAVRERLTQLLLVGGDDTLRVSDGLRARCLVPRAEVRMHLPAAIGDYTDFYSSREHATNVGTMFRGKDNALQPNWLHMPIGYHGRASSVVVSGTPVVRPMGQLQLDKADPTKGSEHAPCRLLDFELEMGFFIGGPPNPRGMPIDMAEAEERIFGHVLCNDWSARDVQKFEYVPLGPFGAKNFATSISPWIVPAEALEPFRCATSAGSQTAPTPLPYLQDPKYGSFDVSLEVALTPKDGSSPTVISASNYRHLYWSCVQQLVHHSVTGCDMRPGDMLASGTISGKEPSSYGSMLELSWQGTQTVGPLCDGSTRKFLMDGDTVSLTGVCRHPSGYSIGFGACVGQVLPSKTPPPPTLPAPPACALHDVALQSYWRSSCSWRVRVALAFYGVPYAYEAVNLLEGQQASVSPMGEVPRLDWTDGAGTRHSLTQSLAIIELLMDSCDGADGAGAGSGRATSSLRPIEAVDRARAREIAMVIAAGTQPLQNLGHIKAIETVAREAPDARAVAKAAIAKGLAAVEALAAANRDGRYCVGARTSIADVCLVPQLYNARRFGVDLGAYPRLCAVEAHLSTLPCFQAAHPDVQPDMNPAAAK